MRHSKTAKHLKNEKSRLHVQPIKVALASQSSTALMERRIVMHLVEHNVPFTHVDHLTKLIKECALAPNVAQNIQCSRTKATEIVCNQFAPEQTETLSSILRDRPFSIIMDESTDQGVCKVLAIVVRYFETKTVSRLLSLIEVPECKSQNLYAKLTEKFTSLNIPIKNLIGYGADNASVMMGAKSGLKALLSKDVPGLFTFGCACHSMALCSTAASKQLPAYLERFVHETYNHFSHSAKRKSQFVAEQAFHQVEQHAILRPCETRWLSLKVCFSILFAKSDF